MVGAGALTVAVIAQSALTIEYDIYIPHSVFDSSPSWAHNKVRDSMRLAHGSGSFFLSFVKNSNHFNYACTVH